MSVNTLALAARTSGQISALVPGTGQPLDTQTNTDYCVLGTVLSYDSASSRIAWRKLTDPTSVASANARTAIVQIYNSNKLGNTQVQTIVAGTYVTCYRKDVATDVASATDFGNATPDWMTFVRDRATHAKIRFGYTLVPTTPIYSYNPWATWVQNAVATLCDSAGNEFGELAYPSASAYTGTLLNYGYIGENALLPILRISDVATVGTLAPVIGLSFPGYVGTLVDTVTTISTMYAGGSAADYIFDSGIQTNTTSLSSGTNLVKLTSTEYNNWKYWLPNTIALRVSNYYDKPGSAIRLNRGVFYGKHSEIASMYVDNAASVFLNVMRGGSVTGITTIASPYRYSLAFDWEMSVLARINDHIWGPGIQVIVAGGFIARNTVTNIILIPNTITQNAPFTGGILERTSYASTWMPVASSSMMPHDGTWTYSWCCSDNLNTYSNPYFSYILIQMTFVVSMVAGRVAGIVITAEDAKIWQSSQSHITSSVNVLAPP